MKLDIQLTHRQGDFTLNIEQALNLNGFTALAGPNGAGKTTLLRLLAGYDRVTDGEIRLEGDRLDLIKPHMRRIGFVTQKPGLFEHLSVSGNLDYAQHRNPSGVFDRGTLVEWLGLSRLLDRPARVLSGGEAQRLALARTLLGQPRLLLMDEAFTALDTATRRQLIPALSELARDHALPVLFISHNIDEMAYLADQITWMQAGQLGAPQSASGFFARDDLAEAGFIEAGVLITAVLQTPMDENGLSALELAGQPLHLPGLPHRKTGDRIRLRLLARDVALSRDPVAGVSIQNQIPCRIETVCESAAHIGQVHVHLIADDQRLKARITHNALKALDLRPGSDVFALIRTAHLADPLARM